MKDSIPPYSTTGIGSLPHHSHEDACELISRTCEIPFWPQLPQRSFRESMIIQYSEGLPFLRIDEKNEKAFLDHNGSDELDRFYETCDPSLRIAVSEDYAAGFFGFLRTLSGEKLPFLKGHITGPLTFTLGLRDTSGKYAYYDEELREISAMLLQAKARWQIDQLRKHADTVIMFIDEPILSALGSTAYLGVNREETVRLLSMIVSAIEEAGAVPGIHCCGRADWPVVTESGPRIINFDAYEYFEPFILYRSEIGEFLEKGGYIALGIVPTSDAIGQTGMETLIDLLGSRIARLRADFSSPLVNERLLLTPACGAGSRSVEEATKIFQLLMRLRESVSP